MRTPVHKVSSVVYKFEDEDTSMLSHSQRSSKWFSRLRLSVSHGELCWSACSAVSRCSVELCVNLCIRNKDELMDSVFGYTTRREYIVSPAFRMIMEAGSYGVAAL
jgi:hypothetical protein